MENLLQDVRFGIRVLLKTRSLTAMAVLALTLGIGANTAVFSVVNAILLRPLPFKAPEQIVTIWSINPSIQLGFDKFPCSAGQFIDYRDQSDVFENTTALDARSFNLENTSEPEKLGGALVSADFFAALGIEPYIGRTFLPEEDRPGGNQVVILSYSLWKRRFGGDPGVIGQALALNGKSYIVVGVMPAGFDYPRAADMPAYMQFSIRTEVWSPIAFDSDEIMNRRAGFNYPVLARLKTGMSLEQAWTQLSAIASRNEQRYPQTDGGFSVKLLPVRDQIVGSLRPALLVLLGAVGFVLLIACANVANLLLARGAARQKEMAVRTALGASRFRIVQQLLTESGLLSLSGAAFGLLLAFWGVKLLVAATPDNIPRVKDVTLDLRVLAFTLAVAVVTSLIFGLAPALQASKADLNESLKEGGRGSTEGRRTIRELLVISEVALALVLLIGAGLMIRSFQRLYQVDPGLDPNHVLTMQLSLPYARYSKPTQRAALYRRILQQINELPGVQAVAAVSTIPLSGAEFNDAITIEGRPLPQSVQESPIACVTVTSLDYFRVMGIPLLKGRPFNPTDNRDAPRVAIINETFARRFFPEEDPLGKRIRLFADLESGEAWFSIVGVVRDVKHTALDSAPKPEVFRSLDQGFFQDLAVVMRTNIDPLSAADAARSEIWAVDKDMPVFNIASMSQIISRSVSRQRFNLLLMSLFALIALLLASVGIYGVMSYAVIQRTQEIGIRMAVGARAADVLRMVVGQGMALVLIGLSAGIVAALALTRLIASLLFSTSATEPATFVGISLLLAAVAFIANLIPARRATKIDPLIALRCG